MRPVNAPKEDNAVFEKLSRRLFDSLTRVASVLKAVKSAFVSTSDTVPIVCQIGVPPTIASKLYVSVL